MQCRNIYRGFTKHIGGPQVEDRWTCAFFLWVVLKFLEKEVTSSGIMCDSYKSIVAIFMSRLHRTLKQNSNKFKIKIVQSDDSFTDTELTYSCESWTLNRYNKLR
jgi:hypothetical protein